MRVPYVDTNNRPIEILDSRDLTDEEWALVKKNVSGVLSQRDLPNNRRES
jgi:hypothetical protein